MLHAEHISLERDQGKVIDNIDITVVPGRFTALLGPNGAGKSTLLALLAGRERPQQGRVTLDGECLSLWDHAALARRRGVLSQQVHLAFGFTALEVVLLGRCPHHRGSERDEDLRIAQQTLHAVDAAHLQNRSYLELSGGEQQRIQLARVLAQIWDHQQRPAYLLLDEPEAGLDIAHQHFVLQLARDLAERGLGVIAVLHDINLAVRYAHHAAVIENGQLRANGPCSESLDAELLSDIYGIALTRHELPHLAARCLFSV